MMNIASILARKGGRSPRAVRSSTIRQALALLAEHNIGALVVVDEAAAPAGILSERDIVREAARDERLFGADRRRDHDAGRGGRRARGRSPRRRGTP